MTRSRRILIEVLQRTTGVTIAARLRVRPSTVTRWANGDCVPNAHHAEKLETIYDVPAAHWQSVTRVTHQRTRFACKNG